MYVDQGKAFAGIFEIPHRILDFPPKRTISISYLNSFDDGPDTAPGRLQCSQHCEIGFEEPRIWYKLWDVQSINRSPD